MGASNSHLFSEAKNINVDCLAQCEAVNMFSAKLIPFLASLLHVKGDCLAGSCEKTFLDVYQDVLQDSEFVGHVFHNSVTLNPIQCYTWCIQDCRCLSFNLKEKNAEKYCELNEGNHFTNKSSLKQSHGSSYYILRRKYEAKVKNYSLELARRLRKNTFVCYDYFCQYKNVYILPTDWRKKRKQERILVFDSKI